MERSLSPLYTEEKHSLLCIKKGFAFSLPRRHSLIFAFYLEERETLDPLLMEKEFAADLQRRERHSLLFTQREFASYRFENNATLSSLSRRSLSPLYNEERHTLLSIERERERERERY